MKEEEQQKQQQVVMANIPAMHLAGYRRKLAKDNGVEKNLLLTSCGGLGDQICAFPTIRYTFDKLVKKHGYEVSLLTSRPELYKQFAFKKVYNILENEMPDDYNKYNIFNMIAGDRDFSWDFICGLFVHCIDFASLNAYKMTLPFKYKQIEIKPALEDYIKPAAILEQLEDKPFVVLHFGLTWPSKAPSVEFCQEVIKHIKKAGVVPVLIGNTEERLGQLKTTVDHEVEKGVLDLRNEMTVLETIAFLKSSKVILCNDSGPLHMAAATDVWIGFFSTVKDPDNLLHYRYGEYGWRMKSFGRDHIWNTEHVLAELDIRDLGDRNKNWFPHAETFARWGIMKAIANNAL